MTLKNFRSKLVGKTLTIHSVFTVPLPFPCGENATCALCIYAIQLHSCSFNANTLLLFVFFFSSFLYFFFLVRKSKSFNSSINLSFFRTIFNLYHKLFIGEIRYLLVCSLFSCSFWIDSHYQTKNSSLVWLMLNPF